MENDDIIILRTANFRTSERAVFKLPPFVRSEDATNAMTEGHIVMSRVAFEQNRRRIRRVVEYLDANAVRSPQVVEIASVACLSPFHFLRVYGRYVGETPGETQIRLRLSQAQRLLAAGHSVADVSARIGYGSPQSLAHAFRRGFGRTPSSVAAGSGLPNLPPRIEWLTPTRLAMARYSGRMVDAHDFFDGFVAKCVKSEAEFDARSLGAIVAGDSFGEDGRIIGLQGTIAIKDIPRGLDSIVMPGGPHLAFRDCGALPALPASLSQYLDYARVHLGLQRDDSKLICRPLRDPSLTPPSERVWDLLIPLRPI